MEVFRPLQISFNQQIIEQDRKFFWVASASMGIKISTGEPLLEMNFMKDVIEGMGDMPMPDPGMPKPQGEFLLSGSFYSPTGEPVKGGQVSVKLGELEKTIAILGPRQWSMLGSTSQQEIINHKIEYKSAWGGPEFPMNIAGMGYKGEELPLQEYPGNLVQSANDTVPPASLGVVDIMSSQRQQYQGTYDHRYLENYFPGFPPDTDWRYFMNGAEDQWINGHFSGTESFQLSNVSPEKSIISGNLPGYKPRCFAYEKSANGAAFKEYSLKLDTVWFIPDKDVMLLIWRGGISVPDDDASILQEIILGYETAEETRDVAYYQDAMDKRLVSNDALFKSINAYDLVPSQHKSALDLFQDMIIEGESGAFSENIDAKISDINGMVAEKVAEQQTRVEEGITSLDKNKLEGLPDINSGELLKSSSATTDPALLKMNGELEKVFPGISTGDIEKLKLREFSFEKVEKIQQIIKDFADTKESEAKNQGLDELTKQKQRLLAILGEGGADEERIKKSIQSLEDAENQISGEAGLAALPRVDRKVFSEMLSQQIEPQISEQLNRIRLLRETGAAQEQVTLAEENLREFRDKHLKEIEESLIETEKSFLDGYRMGAQFMDKGLSPHDNDDERKAELIKAITAGADVSGQDWACLDLSGENLTGADFSGCLLEQVNFSGAILKGANFNEAIMVRANLDKADFSGSSFLSTNLGEVSAVDTNFGNSNFVDAVFSRGDFSSADFSNCTLNSVQLLEATLKNTCFTDTVFDKLQMIELDIEGSSFKSARIHSGSFVNCKISSCDFSQADLTSTTWANNALQALDFSDAILHKNNFVGIDEENQKILHSKFNRSISTYANFQGMDIHGGLFESANVSNSNFSLSNLRDCNFSNCTGHQAHFRKADLTNSEWLKSDLMESVMSGAVLSGANFSGSNMYAVDFIRSTMGATKFNNCNLDATLIKDWRPS